MSKKIFVTKKIPGPAIEMLEQKGFEVTVSEKDGPLSAQELHAALTKESYDGVLSLLNDKIDASVYDAAPSVKIYSNYAVGYNNFDLAEAKKRGITVTNTPSLAVNESVAEHTFALLLTLAHRIVEGDKFVRAGKYRGWDPDLLIGMDVRGMTLGVIGAGRIGTSVIEKAVKGFGMKVVYYDVVRNKHAEETYQAEYRSAVDDVLAAADVVTLHVNLTDETRHLINAERLKLMKRGAYLVNTCRGAVVDEQALCDALKNGTIRGAALDVYEHETRVSEELVALRNAVLTPHIASATESARDDMSVIAAQALVDFFDGKKPVHAVV